MYPCVRESPWGIGRIERGACVAEVADADKSNVACGAGYSVTSLARDYSLMLYGELLQVRFK